MNTQIKRLLAFVLTLCMLCGTILCTDRITTQAATVKLSQTSATLIVKDKLRLYIMNSKSKVEWSTSDKMVAAVDKNGIVTAKQAGNVTITAKVGSKKLNCKITVVNMNNRDLIYLANSLTNFLTIARHPETCEVQSIEYGFFQPQSYQREILNEEAKWCVKYAIKGETKEKVEVVGYFANAKASGHFGEGSGMELSGNSKTLKIFSKSDVKKFNRLVKDFLKKPYPMDANFGQVAMSRSKLALSVGQRFMLILNNSDTDVKWESANSSIATVSSKGEVKAVKAGTTTIKAMVDGKTYKCKLTVLSKYSEEEMALLANITYLRKKAYHPEKVRITSFESGKYERKSDVISESESFYRPSKFSHKAVVSFVCYDENMQQKQICYLGRTEKNILMSDWDIEGMPGESRYTESTERVYSASEIKDFQEIVESEVLLDYAY